MISKIKNIYENFESGKSGTINSDSVSVSSAPVIIEEPIYDEINDTTPPSEFGQVDNQRHFGILRYIVFNRFRLLMLIALVNLVVVLFIFVFFLIAHLDKKHDNVFVSSTLHNYLETTTTFTPTTSTPTTSAPTTSAPTTSEPTTKTGTTVQSHSSTTTTKPFEYTDCTPNEKSTFLFAYSYDLTSDEVLNTWKSFSENSNLFFETYVIGRFDMVNSMNQSVLAYDSDNSLSGAYGVLLNGLPNCKEYYSIKDPSQGGEVFGIIESFFDSDVTFCGATIFIIAKRLPTYTSIDDLVSKLKKNHAYVTFVVSENSFGWWSPEPMYRLASETNGLCIFTEDDKIQKTPSWLPSIWPSSLVYSFNAKVTNTGTFSLPIFNSPLVGNYYICMTLQDHGYLDTFRMVNLSWYNAGSSKSGSFEETVESHTGYGNTTFIRKGQYRLDAVPYYMRLGFEYSGDKSNILQIRIYSVGPVDFWVPYNN